MAGIFVSKGGDARFKAGSGGRMGALRFDFNYPQMLGSVYAYAPVSVNLSPQ